MTHQSRAHPRARERALGYMYNTGAIQGQGVDDIVSYLASIPLAHWNLQSATSHS